MGGRRGKSLSIDVKKRCIKLIAEAINSGASASACCMILGIGKRSYNRWNLSCTEDMRNGPTSSPHNKLTKEERTKVIHICTQEKYCDLPPSQLVPTLADDGLYIASESSFYRILHEEKMQFNRTNKREARRHKKPTPLVATRPNQVWSWDITYLPTTIKGQFFYLYMIMDIYSRKIVGWEVHEKESMEYSAELIEITCLCEDVKKGKLTLHSDNGSPMKGSTMLAKLYELQVAASFSRPSVSNDNPYSESLFGTMKCCPIYPNRPFDKIEEAREWTARFVVWYNEVHLHSGINFVTPESKHSGKDVEVLRRRERVYEKAKKLNPNRWSKKTRNWNVVEEVSLNPLKENLAHTKLEKVMH